MDASPVGLRADLTQLNPRNTEDTRIIAYASRQLTATERKYSQIEKEGLACVWGCEKFHLYLYAGPFELVTDNKTIELIFRNPLSQPPARIQGWGLRLSSYDFQIIHRPGLGNMADYLSRHPSKQLISNADEAAERFVNLLVASSAADTHLDIDQIASATSTDQSLSKIIQLVEQSAQGNLHDQCKKLASSRQRQGSQGAQRFQPRHERALSQLEWHHLERQQDGLAKQPTSFKAIGTSR